MIFPENKGLTKRDWVTNNNHKISDQQEWQKKTCWSQKGLEKLHKSGKQSALKNPQTQNCMKVFFSVSLLLLNILTYIPCKCAAAMSDRYTVSKSAMESNEMIFFTKT